MLLEETEENLLEEVTDIWRDVLDR